MSASTSSKRKARPDRREAATHLFILGQSVRLRGGFANNAAIYRITATLPPRDDSPQYRIRNDEERYERVTTQDSLEPVHTTRAEEGAALIERTFGHGQGTETQQSRNQKT